MLFKLCGLAAALMIGRITAAPVQAVIVDGAAGDNSVTQPVSPVAGLNNVGSIPAVYQVVANSSGVYLGNGWVLTAYHIGTVTSETNFILGGNTFTPDGSVQRIYADQANQTGPTDMMMFHLKTTPNPVLFPNLTLSSATPSDGTPFYTKGNGLTRSTSLAYYYVTSTNNNNSAPYTWTPTTATDPNENASGYTESQPNILWYGSNTVANPGGMTFISSPNNGSYGSTVDFASNFLQNGDAQLSPGDSGGGVFDANNNLIGINETTFPTTVPLEYQPANTAIFGDASGYMDIATYRTQIEGILATPEPGTIGLLLCSVPMLLRRRRRRAA